LDRPWEFLADLAATTGDAALARRVLAGYQRDEAPFARDPQGREAFYAAHVAFAEQRWDDAARLFREADARTAVFDRYAWVWMARAHDLAGRPDSAAAYYEKFLTRPDAVDVDGRWRAPVHRWLGEIYEAKGDTRRAIEHYGRFVELWANADPELQPQVHEVRSRLERLRTRAG
jgi:tetratricopeptide (TPR) repeat protein